MSILRSAFAAAAAVLVASVGAPARADLAFEITPSSALVAPGGEVLVTVHLVETGTDLLSAGLIAADFRLLFNEPARTADPAQVVERILNPEFDAPSDPQPGIVAATATTSGVAAIVQSSIAAVLPDAQGRILLGTFRFLAGTTLGSVTNLAVADFDPAQGVDNFVTGDFDAIDARILGGTATIAVVPEPSSLTLAGLGLALGLAARARRRRAA